MTEYRRFYIPNVTWFFTVNLAERRNNVLLVNKIDELGNTFRYVKKTQTVLYERCRHYAGSLALYLDIAGKRRRLFRELEFI